MIDQAPATVALLCVNIFISIYAFTVDRNFINQFAFQVGAVRDLKQHYRIFTSSFLHANPAHLLLNMMTLFFFGPDVERELGLTGFIVVYFGSIIASGLISLAANRNNPSYASVGASDAISGVVLSYCCFYPFKPLYIMFLPIGVPAIFYGALYIAISAQLMGRENRIIAHEGHLGGALAGAALTILMRPEVILQFFR